MTYRYPPKKTYSKFFKKAEHNARWFKVVLLIDGVFEIMALHKKVPASR